MIVEELNRKIIEVFPNLKSKYLDEVNWQEGDSTGSHVVYGDVFTPYFINCIEEENIDEVKKLFKFIEDLLNMNNAYVKDVVTLSVLESSLSILKHDEYLQDLMGQETSLVYNRLKKSYDSLNQSEKEKNLKINLDDSKEIERFLLIAIIGLLESLQCDAISINEIDRRLFSPYTFITLEEMKVKKEIIELIKDGCLLEDFESIIPDKLDDEIIRIKEEALSLLKGYKNIQSNLDTYHWLENDR
ncbi:DUF7674 family protein [Breznakia pachnodae]|uniref:Fe-S cluster-containing protein n=1 Tax=Breznakia pachnodae TaxID=265178 RepID=A0ABU0E159_9FIRM|nr:DUF3969 family protein [Breznakia pachnodae]MDQ0360618.1 putative Fe-S cluster-containing protein [Breznakia pachnodae]